MCCDTKECLRLLQCFVVAGVGLAVLEKAEIISPIIDSNGTRTSAGTVSAGYQNFLICIEMFCAAVALRYAFPHRVYIQGCITDSRGRSVTMQSISSSLKVKIIIDTYNIIMCASFKLPFRVGYGIKCRVFFELLATPVD